MERIACARSRSYQKELGTFTEFMKSLYVRMPGEKWSGDKVAEVSGRRTIQGLVHPRKDFFFFFLKSIWKTLKGFQLGNNIVGLSFLIYWVRRDRRHARMEAGG